MRRALVLLWFLSLALGQSGPNPENVADEAVQRWQEREQLDVMTLANLPPADMCEELLAFVQDPPPPQGIRVNLADRLELPQEDEARRLYSYPAAVGDTRLEVVEVTLAEANGVWQAERVGLRLDAAGVRLPALLRDPAAGWGFIVFSVVTLFLALTQSWLRRWLEQGMAVMRQHKRIVIGTVIALYGAFLAGTLTGAGLPAECEAAFAGLIGSGLGTIGILEVAQRGDVAQLAAVITYWNFTMGTLLTTLLPAYLLAVPAYLINAVRFFALGIPFGFNLDPTLLALQAPVIVLELLAYILVTAGGGIFLATLLRKGFGAYREGLTNLLLMLPLALLLLIAAAWYEAYLIL